MPQSWSDWVTFIGVILGLLGLAREWINSQHVNRSTDAQTMEKYASLLRSAAEREMDYQKKIELLEGRLETVEKKLETAEANSARFERWAKRLSQQVIALRGIPVEIEPGLPPEAAS